MINKMICQIDGEEKKFRDGETILDIAERSGIRIPTLCHMRGEKPFASCMVCAVEDVATGELLPACSTRAHSGMDIKTETEKVAEQRRSALELLLSEHLGDCEGPCRLACPAFLDIPKIIRLTAAKDLDSAAQILLDTLVFPRIISQICDAPCEKGCRRARIDESVSIRFLARFASDASSLATIPPACKRTAVSVAIIGAGIAGLACAAALTRSGIPCEVFEMTDRCWGGLANFAESKGLSKILDDELQLLREAGVRLHLNSRVPSEVTSLDKLRSVCNAVVLATGDVKANKIPPDKLFGVKTIEKGVWTDPATFATSLAKVYAIGDNVIPLRSIARSVADAKLLCEHLLAELKVTSSINLRRSHSGTRFSSHFGKLHPDDMVEFQKAASSAPQVKPIDEADVFTHEEALEEVARCLKCDCAAAADCRLRELADEFSASQKKRASRRKEERRPFKRVFDGDIVFEPGKCVKCGRCMAICARFEEKNGPVFLNRGYDTEIAFPFAVSPKKGLGSALCECVETCPTGAMVRGL